MSGETWPKESQRLGSMFPRTGPDAGRFCGRLNLEVLRLPPASPETATPVTRAMDAAAAILAESLDAANDLVPPFEGAERVRIDMGLAMAKMAMVAYAAHYHGDVLRECTPEIAGAVESVVTDVLAGLAEGLQGHYKGQTCRCGT